jgi:hypothetical protein
LSSSAEEEESTPAHERASRVAIALPAILLVSVACSQIVLTRTLQLSPWKGGGFGMFASLDGLGFRHVRLFVEATERSEELDLPDSLVDPATRAAVLPTNQSLTTLARQVLAHERRLDRPAARARVEVWRTQFTTTLESTEARLATLTLDRDAPQARPAR